MLLVLSLYTPHTIIEKYRYQHNITQMYFNQLRKTRVLSDDAILTSQSYLVELLRLKTNSHSTTLTDRQSRFV